MLAQISLICRHCLVKSRLPLARVVTVLLEVKGYRIMVRTRLKQVSESHRVRSPVRSSIGQNYVTHNLHCLDMQRHGICGCKAATKHTCLKRRKWPGIQSDDLENMRLQSGPAQLPTCITRTHTMYTSDHQVCCRAFPPRALLNTMTGGGFSSKHL